MSREEVKYVSMKQLLDDGYVVPEEAGKKNLMVRTIGDLEYRFHAVILGSLYEFDGIASAKSNPREEPDAELGGLERESESLFWR